VNSTVFSVLARSIANPQTNGYFKFNKQFLEPIPFPVENFASNVTWKKEILQIVQKIEKFQKRYIAGTPNQRKGFGKALQAQWATLDQKVYKLYDLSEEEIQFFQQRGRNVNRIQFLTS
ncbi:MAG: hypothetical protein AAGG68_29195, partial [Bacteroidota bacterium]